MNGRLELGQRISAEGSIPVPKGVPRARWPGSASLPGRRVGRRFDLLASEEGR